MSEKYTYLTAKQLSERIPYTARYINEVLKDQTLIEGVRYIRPFNRRKILYLWEPIETLMWAESESQGISGIPLSSGGVCHG